MRLTYHIRVILISVEALTLLIAASVWALFQPQLSTAAMLVSMSSEVVKYLLLLPLALVPWIAAEVRHLLYEDKETTRLLAQWPDFWRLKSHVFAALGYALLFGAISVVPWFLVGGIATGSGFLLFCTSVVGQLAVVASVYVARLKVKEVVALAGAA